MAEIQTRPTNKSVDAFLDNVEDESRRDDCRLVLNLMKEVTGAEAEMWGPSIVGFGRYKTVYANGKEAEFPVISFSPRKSDLTLYLAGLDEFPDLLSRLGKHKTAKVCLYLKTLADVDVEVLRELVVESVATMEEQRVDNKR